MPKKSEQIQARLNKAEADARALKRALAEAKREEKREAKAAQRKRDQQTGLSLVAELRANGLSDGDMAWVAVVIAYARSHTFATPDGGRESVWDAAVREHGAAR